MSHHHHHKQQQQQQHGHLLPYPPDDLPRHHSRSHSHSSSTSRPHSRQQDGPLHPREDDRRGPSPQVGPKYPPAPPVSPHYYQQASPGPPAPYPVPFSQPLGHPSPGPQAGMGQHGYPQGSYFSPQHGPPPMQGPPPVMQQQPPQQPPQQQPLTGPARPQNKPPLGKLGILVADALENKFNPDKRRTRHKSGEAKRNDDLAYGYDYMAEHPGGYHGEGGHGWRKRQGGS